MSETLCTKRRQAVEVSPGGSNQIGARQWAPMEHDWRLWERKKLFHFGSKPGDGKSDPFFTETWYCTRCRHIENRRGTS